MHALPDLSDEKCNVWHLLWNLQGDTPDFLVGSANWLVFLTAASGPVSSFDVTTHTASARCKLDLFWNDLPALV